ncbi:MAG: cytochrome c biogenesis protein CcsA [Flavobacteriaceae bacterium]|jgi:cytochrome c-type biogenesis protein CcsB|nr:cytochrome c biogenesis protein CcsA [Flavobacteriaceae bacterium]
MTKFEKFFFSTRTMTVLLFIYAISMAVATFIENDYDTPTAKALIYEAKWFEVLMLWLIILFIGNIKRYRLLRREKWPVLIFHLSFVFIFLGGAITRYISFEGQMPIREGETTNEIISDRTYFKLEINDKERALRYDKNTYMLSHFNAKDTPWPFKRTYKEDYPFGDKVVTLKTLDYIPLAKDSIERTNSGKKMLEIVTMGEGGRETDYIGEGEIRNIGGTMISYNNPIEGSVQLIDEDGKLMINSPFEGQYMTMTGQEVGVVTDSALLAEQSGSIGINEPKMLNYRTLYTINNTNFIIPTPAFQGRVVYYKGDKTNQSEKDLPGAIIVELSSGNEKDTLTIIGGRGLTSFSKNTTINGLGVSVGFGSKIIHTPFSIRCDDFILDRYPGSMNPSSYESEITVIDRGQETPHHIYMNNVMDYRGYRFFQSSYFPDEGGTILSVNADWWGTNITYVGYFLLFFGLFATLFWKGTHFWKLNKQLTDLHKKTLVLLPFLFLFGTGISQDSISTDSLPTAHKEVQASVQFMTPNSGTQFEVDPIHSEKFGRLLVQDFEGRIKPMNTHTLELLRKIYKKDRYRISKDKSVSSDQWFLAMQIDPTSWADADIIKVAAKGGEELLAETQANAEGYTSYMKLVDPHTGQYKLESQYNAAFSKRAADQSNYDKEVINITERFNVFSNIVYGYYTKVIPIQNDPGESWTSWIYSTEDSPVEINKVAYDFITQYYNNLKSGFATGDWTGADKSLQAMVDYQHEWGKNVIPSDAKVNLEVMYNKVNIFFWLMIVYSMLGGVLIFLAFIEVFSTENRLGKIIHKATLFFLGLLGLAFLVHLLGLAARWYLSGHAPWSNGYEAIVFISSIGVLSGLILYRNRNAFIPAAGAIVAMIMMGFAHGGGLLDPQITPLVPVLKSYWLMVHVGIITSSYGFFGLSAVIGIISLILLCFKPTPKIKKSIQEITIVSEMASTIGLFALTVGTFLGGMWANESWGRYWSWDPKETWAFISVIVYAIVLHLRLVPGLRGKWAFNMASMWAIWSIIMTYFGVNYYLSGLHSYAAGDPIPIPAWIYYTAAFMLILSLISYFRDKKFNQKKKKKIKKDETS